MLHPEIEKRLDLASSTFIFEMRVDGLLEANLPDYHALSKFPSIRRDIAVVVDREISLAQVETSIRRAAPANLKEILIFDVYTGEKIDSRLKSLALGLILQETSHTLTDSEVEGAMADVLQALKHDLNAQLRD